jgi:hypothetical protein
MVYAETIDTVSGTSIPEQWLWFGRDVKTLFEVLAEKSFADYTMSAIIYYLFPLIIRCGMPDMVVKDDGLQGIVDVNDGPANFTLAGGKWKCLPVKYGYVTIYSQEILNILT